MKLYITSSYNGETVYSAHDGMDLTVVTGLLTDLGHTNITEISETDYTTYLDSLPRH